MEFVPNTILLLTIEPISAIYSSGPWPWYSTFQLFSTLSWYIIITIHSLWVSSRRVPTSGPWDPARARVFSTITPRGSFATKSGTQLPGTLGRRPAGTTEHEDIDTSGQFANHTTSPDYLSCAPFSPYGISYTSRYSASSLRPTALSQYGILTVL